VLWRKIGAALFLTASLGCQSSAPAIVSLEECPDLDFTPCDRQTTACQERMLAIAACVYPVDAKSPSVRVHVMTEEELASTLGAELDETDAATLPHLERALGDLALVKPGDLTAHGGETAGIAARIGGIYRSKKLGIALVDRDADTEAEKDAELIREYVLALEDAQYDLAAWQEQHPSTIDARLALRSVTEGQATFVQYRVLSAFEGYDAHDIDWITPFENLRSQRPTAVLGDDSPYLAATAGFPDALGAVLANAAWQSDGSSFHSSVFKTPPETTLEVVTQNLGRDVPTVTPPPFQVATATEDHALVEDTALGSFLFAFSAHQLGDDSSDAFARAPDWRGDELWIYAGPDDSTAWLWELQLVDDAAAESFRKLARHAHLTTAAAQDRVFVIGGDDPPSFLNDAGQAFLQAER